MPFNTRTPSTFDPVIPTNKLPEDDKQLGYVDVIKDAFVIDNVIAGAIKGISKDRDVDPKSRFNPYEQAENDGIILQNPDDMLYVDNEKEYQAALAQIKVDDNHRQRVADAGFKGFLATMTAVVASPSAFIGGQGLVKAFKVGHKALKTAAVTSAAVGTTVLGEEKLLQATQTGRSDEEVMKNIAAAAVLTGILSGGAVKLKNRKMDKAVQQIKGTSDAINEVGKLPDGLGDFARFDDSVGAARDSESLTALPIDQLGIKKSDNVFLRPFQSGVNKVNKLWNPAVRMLSSKSKNARLFMLESADSSLKPELVKEHALDESLEGALKRRQSEFAAEGILFSDNYSKYKKATNNPLGWGRFRDEVGKVYYSKIPSNDPLINKAALDIDNYAAKLGNDMDEVKLFPEDLDKNNGIRQAGVLWNTRGINADIPRFKESIRGYMTEQLTKAKNKLIKDMDAGPTPSTSKFLKKNKEDVPGVTGDSRLAKSIRKLQEDKKATGKDVKTRSLKADNAREEFNKYFSDQESFNSYLEESLSEVKDIITKTMELPNYIPTKSSLRGPLKDMSFDIPFKDVQEFVNTDALAVMYSLSRKVAPAIESKKKFGNRTFEDMKQSIKDDYNDLEKDATAKEAKKLTEERKEVLRDAETTWNLLMGTYRGFGGPVDSILKRGSEALLTHNYLTLLGGVLVSSLPDASMGILRRGFGNFFGNSLKPYLQDLAETGGKMSRTEAKSYGQMFEYAGAIRSQSLYNLADPMAYGSSPFERVLGSLGNKMSTINGINHWNDQWQVVATLGIRFRIVNNVADFAKKGKIGKREEEWMNFMGLGKQDRAGIAEQIKKHGETDVRGDVIPMIENWDNEVLVRKLKAAIGKEVDRTVITKGVTDIPRFGNTTLGRMMFQYMNFTFAFNNKVLLSGLQDADGRVMAGLASLQAMGMATEYLKNKSSGQPMPENAAQWIDAGLDRSGIIGLMAYGNGLAESALGVSYKSLLGEEPRPANPAKAIQAALGPSGKTLSNMAGILQSTFKEDYTKSDIHRMRGQAWFNNVEWFKPIVNQLEKTVAKEFRNKRKPKKRKKKNKNNTNIRR